MVSRPNGRPASGSQRRDPPPGLYDDAGATRHLTGPPARGGTLGLPGNRRRPRPTGQPVERAETQPCDETGRYDGVKAGARTLT